MTSPDPPPDPIDGERPVFDEYGTTTDHQALRRADPEHNLIAALLNMPTAADAADVLAHIHDTDLDNYLARVTLGWIRQAVTRHEPPTPQAVAALARGPVADEREPHPGHERATRYVLEVFTLGLPLTVWSTARQVIEDSYRRSFGDYGDRAAQMAAAFADVEDLEQLTGTAVSQWRTTRARLRAVTEHANRTA